MNPRVKQAQKKRATIGDVAAGLFLLRHQKRPFKVIKLRDFNEIGDHCIVRGGTFMSDATLRVELLIAATSFVRTLRYDGAYGAALRPRSCGSH